MAMFNPAHPGELIKETLEVLGEETGKVLSIKEIADGLVIKPRTRSLIIKGKQSVTPELAIKLSAAFSKYITWILVTGSGQL